MIPDSILVFNTDSLVFYSIAIGYFEPLEGVDSFDVLLDITDSGDNGFYPGFHHRFVSLLFYCNRIFRVHDRHVDMSIRPSFFTDFTGRWPFNEPLEGVDSFDVLLDMPCFLDFSIFLFDFILLD